VEAIENAGFRTAAFTEGGYLSRYFGLDLGFSKYYEEEGEVQFLSYGEARIQDARGGIENTFRLAREWLASNGDVPFFLFIHTYEPHTPYQRHTFTEGLSHGKVGETFAMEKLELLQTGALRFDEKELEYLEALYDGGICEADRHVGSFLDFLLEQGLRDRTLVVVTSDHGEELGKHYPSRCGDHGHSLLDSLVRVPLIIHNPLEDYPIDRVPQQVRLMDVMPTIADILGVSTERELAGRSLLPLMRGVEKAARLAYGTQIRAGPDRIFLRYLGYKYVRVVGPPLPDQNPLFPLPPSQQLYDLKKDYGERSNLVEKKPEILEQMINILNQMRTSGGLDQQQNFTVPEETDGALRKRLKSLGYTY
jgi:arylsulfatase A-like enzyme